MPKTEVDPQLSSDNMIHNSPDNDGDDPWDDDEDMEREWHRMQQQFHTIGYREGLMAGKEKSAQEGFNPGFKESVFVGQTWGLVRGVTSALACLPDALKEKLVETDEKRNRLQHLYESVRGTSTIDALKLFYDGLNDRSSSSCEQGKMVQPSSHTEDLHGQRSEGHVLQNHVQEFNRLVLECSALTVHLQKDL